MTLDPIIITCIAAVMFSAALLQGATGFGFGLIAMGLLPLFLAVDLVSMTVSLVLIPLLVLNLAARYRHFNWRDARYIWIGTVVGVIPGVFLLAAADEVLLKRILGAILIFTGFHDFVISRSPQWIRGSKAGTICGILCGALGGAFNTGGPPAIYYVYNQPWPVLQSIATLQTIFLTTAVMKLILGSSLGLVTMPMLHIVALSIIPMAAGLALGIAIGNRIPAKPLRRGAFLFLGCLGIVFILAP